MGNTINNGSLIITGSSNIIQSNSVNGIIEKGAFYEKETANQTSDYTNVTGETIASEEIAYFVEAPLSEGAPAECQAVSSECGEWSVCLDGIQSRECTDNCGAINTETKECSPGAEVNASVKEAQKLNQRKKASRTVVYSLSSFIIISIIIIILLAIRLFMRGKPSLK